MPKTLRLILAGLAGGMALAGAVALWDRIAHPGAFFGMRTMLYGVMAGAALLTAAFLLAVYSYRLATQGKAIQLRRRLLVASIVLGGAGMSAGFSCAAIWFATGRPWLI